MFKRTKKPKKEKPINTLNTPYLLIVESPSKCAKIEKYLGFQYCCIASQGHIRGLSKVGTSKQKYKPEYKILSEKQKHVEKMNSIIKQFNPMNIFLATDDDREGEGIAWHICEVFDLSVANTKRIIFHEITEKAIKEAVATPTFIRMNIVHAQQARQVIDRMIGFQVSPLLTRMLVNDSNKYLSAGRCQTPTLRLVYDNDKENKRKNTEEMCYQTTGTFFANPSTMDLKLDKKMDEVYCRDFLEESKTHKHILGMKPAMEKTSVAPKPFNTSHLLQTASNILHMSPSLTMSLCQKLYQEGHITYMRTDSRKYAGPFIETIQGYIEEKYGTYFVGELKKVENTDNSNPHEAIRVTNLRVREVTGENRIGVLYNLIWRRTLESCMSDYKYTDHGFEISAPMGYKYKGNIEIPVFLGWKRVHTTDLDFKETQTRNTGMSMYVKTQNKKAVVPSKIECKPGPPERENHYTEAGLIQKMEDLGIGRPSTFSLLVGTIQERKYVEKRNIEGTKMICKTYRLEGKKIEEISQEQVFGAEKNKLVIEELGDRAVIKLLSNFEDLFSYDYTSQMEKELDEIAENKTTYEEVCKHCDDMLKKATKPLKDKMKKTYKIDEKYELIFGKTNPLIQSVNPDGTKDYKNINTKVEIEFEKLENGEYKIEELIDYSERSLGTYKGEKLEVKKGPYGEYVVYGGKNESIKGLVKKGQTIQDLTEGDIINYLEKKKDNATVLRTINNDLFIKTGKYGPYILYKKPTVKKPSFISLKKCPHEYLTCPIEDLKKWLREDQRLDI